MLDSHDANALCPATLREAIGRIDAFCREDRDPPARFLPALAEHPWWAELLTAVGRDMHAGDDPRRQLVEGRSTWRAAAARRCRPRTWIAALAGRPGAHWKEPDAWPENEVFGRHFEDRLTQLQARSAIRD